MVAGKTRLPLRRPRFCPRFGAEDVCVGVPTADHSVTLVHIKAFLREEDVAAYKVPRKLVVFESLPRNSLGVVTKREIRARVRALARR